MGNQTFKVYNADEMTIVFGPVIVDSGFADGEFLRIEQESDDTDDVAGTDGEVSVSRTNDQRATVTFVLMQTSSINDALSGLSNLVKSAPAGAGGIHPLLITDRNGRALFTASNAWVRRAPDRSYDRTAQGVEWQIRCSHLVRFDGGN
jgi:hypothetical protein